MSKIKFHFSVLYLINLWVRKHKCLFMNIIKIVLYLFLFYFFFLTVRSEEQIYELIKFRFLSSFLLCKNKQIDAQNLNHHLIIIIVPLKYFCPKLERSN